jgi:hypothetical protein
MDKDSHDEITECSDSSTELYAAVMRECWPQEDIARMLAIPAFEEIESAYRAADGNGGIDIDSALARIASSFFKPLQNSPTLVRDFYLARARVVVPLLSRQMRAELPSDGPFRNHEELVDAYIAFAGRDRFAELLGICMLAALHSAAVHAGRRLSRRSVRGLEYLLALHDDPQPFWIEEIPIAGERDDVEWLEQLTTARYFLNLPHIYDERGDPEVKRGKAPRRRVSGDNPHDFLMRNAVVEATLNCNFRNADQPKAYVATSAYEIMRGRIRADERERIKAWHANEYDLDSLDDRFVGEGVGALQSETILHIRDLGEALEHTDLPPDVKNVILARAEDTDWKNIPKAIQSKYERSARKGQVRRELSRHAIQREDFGQRSLLGQASVTTHFERVSLDERGRWRGGKVLAHNAQSPKDLAALRDSIREGLKRYIRAARDEK